MKTPHEWSFFRAGGFDQVCLDSGAELAALHELDQKLWVALACPTRGTALDERTLELIDTNGDGRIRAPELVAAVQWACARLKTPDALLAGCDVLPLEMMARDTPEGAAVQASARRILDALGKPDATGISVEDTADTQRIYAQSNCNGDGVVPPDAAADEPAVRAAMQDIVACRGGVADRSGLEGVNRAGVDLFFDDVNAYLTWRQRASREPERLLPFGADTPAAYETVEALNAKVTDFFARCRLLAFDPAAASLMNPTADVYTALASGELTVDDERLAALPLARASAGAALPLETGVNPAWSSRLNALQAYARRAGLGEGGALDETGWQRLRDLLAPYAEWQAAKPGASVEPLGVERLRELAGSDMRERILALIAADEAVAPEVDATVAVERLVRYHRDLYRLLVNFVNFRDFHTRGTPALFQAGTLYIDQRSCDLCLRVDDAAKHASLASLAGAYLLYCDCLRADSNERMTIVAVLTDGGSENLMVGRNGLFYDRQGRDWDATVTRVVDNPIGLRQAFWKPYKKLVRLVEEQVAKRASAADAATAARLETAAAAAMAVPADAKAPAEPRKRFDVGTVAALGVGLGALATAFGGFVAGFIRLAWWQMPLAVLGLVVSISIPSVAISWLKLRRRNLGPLLDANGWAVNAGARISLAFGRSLTRMATLPPGARRTTTEGPDEEARPWQYGVLAVLCVALAWALYRALADAHLF